MTKQPLCKPPHDLSVRLENNMKQQTTIIKGYAQLEKLMESIEGTKKGLWLTCPDKARYVYLTLERVPVVNVGLVEHEFHSLSEANNYIMEFLYN